MLRSTLTGVLLLTIASIAFLTVACSSRTVELWKPDEAIASRPVLSAASKARVALVIGNSAYPSGPLSSPKDDAKAIEAKLNALGYEVTRKTNLGREEFFNAIRDFGDRLQQSGTVGLFYYSGHGMQVSNRNYMIPTDADIRSEVDVVRYAVPVEDVLRRMELGRSNPNIVILDACRNNPFEKRFKSSQEGLAPMDSPASTLIAFAAAPGRVAEAGSGGKLSLYTAVLAEYIDQPYPNFIEMFRTVQNAVYERSGYKQSPRLELPPGLPDFSFKPVVAAILSPTPGPPPALPPAQPAIDINSPAYKAFEGFKECNVCPEMVALPAGEFLMGSSEEMDHREKPQHRVTIAPFAMGKTEVTFAQWDACVAAGGCNGYRPHNRWGRGSRPVIHVSWKDAKAYVSWVSQHTGKLYRLPSEAEWEYAAHAGTTTRYAIPPKNANSGSKVGKTTEAGSFAANPWGLYDMYDDVKEWVEDVWHDNYEGAPTDGTAWMVTKTKKSYLYHVARGLNRVELVLPSGNPPVSVFIPVPTQATSSSREDGPRRMVTSENPTWYEERSPHEIDDRYSPYNLNVGFRVARTLD